MCLAIPGKIIEIQEELDPAFRTGKVSFGGTKRIVNLSMVPDALVDHYVLVHVGVALKIIDEEEAQKTFKYLMEIGEVDEELGIQKPDESK